MYIVSGSKQKQAASSAHAKLEDALAKASEFMSEGMLHVKIDDLGRSDYTDVEIKLLLGLAEAEHFKPDLAPALSPHVAEKPKWNLFKRFR